MVIILTEGRHMVPSPSLDVTRLLRAWSGGDEGALARIVELVYPELRDMARRCLSRERRDHTIQATALVHEAYVRLVEIRQVKWRDRAHFLAVGARVMRRILVDYARARKCAQVVEMRYFGGLTSAEIATVLHVSPQSVHRDWSLAKSWLVREMNREESHGA